ncbi:MAG: lamin tail domain-containing protein [Akkermansiaceae bacterium]
MNKNWCATALFSLLALSSQAEQVVFSEVMYHPSPGSYEFIEVQNLTATPFDIAQWELSGGADFIFPDFNDGAPLDSFLKAFERVVLCNTDPTTFRTAYNVPPSVRVFGPWTGSLDNGGERINLKDKNGVVRCTLAYDDRSPWPLEADGTGNSLILADTSFAIDDYRVWTHGAPTPGYSPILVAEEPFANPEVNLSTGIPFIEYADPWNFHDQNADLGTTWKDEVYNYSTHPGWTLIGAAGNIGGLYGFENSALPGPGIRTPLLNSDNAANHITYYFRKEFTFNGDPNGSTVTIDMINDDSAYFYLNGTPIGGQRIAANAGWKATATSVVGNASEEFNAVIHNGSALKIGTNVLCAEVHQTNASSSDCVFGARMSIAAPTNPSVVINEVRPAIDGFIEFYNPGVSSVDIGGWYLSDEPGNLTKYQIPGSLNILPSGFASIDFVSPFPSIPANTVIYLTEGNGTTTANAINAAIPLDGRSLGRKGDGSSAWYLFSEPTRDTPNTSSSSELSLKINEVEFDNSGNTLWIELFNPSTVTLSASGLSLASQSDLSNKVAITGNIPPSGYASFPISFPDDDGELTLFLANASDNVVDSAFLRHEAPRQFCAAFPDGSDEFFASATGTQNLTNNPDRETGIVITELMVEPITGHRDGEFIELYNNTAGTIDLSGWTFADGVNFTFPGGSSLDAGEYLVIAANESFTSNAHPGVEVVGQYSGELANGGERLRLIDSWGNLADEVHYQTGGTWPILAAGMGSSLELRHPDMDNSMPTAWADSDESNKSTFQTFTITEQFENITTRGSASDYEELHLQAVGDTHLALRNLSLSRNGSGNILPGGGNTVVTNGSGAGGWLCQGTHHASKTVGSEFHLISSGHGDVKANRCEIDVTQIQDNDTLTFTFQGRWISGKPTLLVETWDRSFGGFLHFLVPENLGTPGAVNSSAMAMAAPTVSGLLHSPAVPTSSDPVRVTVNADGADTVTLVHRLDNSTGSGTWINSPMYDDGSNGGDELANDGIYSASVTNYQSNDAIVQFYVEATSAGGTTMIPRPAPEKPAMWVVDNSSHLSDLRLQRFVISARDVNASGGAGDSSTFNYAYPRLSNHYFNATFIGDDQHIIYNCEMRKSGSPWTRSGNSDFSRMKWKTPGDRRFRGYSKRSVDNDAGGGRAYHNRIIRYWLYLFGHPANENEFVRVIINGGSASLREDVEPNANDFLKRNWEDGQLGELYRIDDEWWFDDGWGRSSRNATWEYKNTDEFERYSSEWIKRSRETESDYSSFISWTKMVGNDTFTRPEIERTADIDMMAANAVVRGWCDDWDTLTRNRGKNGYFLRRASDGKWMLIQWDSDLTFGNSNADFIGNLAGVRNFFYKPYIRQRVNHYLHEMVTKYTHNSVRLDAWFQCEEDASTSYSSNQSTYTNWNSNRLAKANSTIGTTVLNTNFDVTSGNGTSLNTSDDTITLNGVAGANAFEIRAVGHPEAFYTFTSTTAWTLSGIQLQQGTNSIVVEVLDQEGAVVDSETFTVNKSGNAFPVAVLDADPDTFYNPISRIFEIDASASYDPEGSSLSYQWSGPGAVTITNPTSPVAQFGFALPGHFTLTLNLTDGDNNTTIISREVTVYPESGRERFNNDTLDPRWTLENLVLRNGATPPASYSLDAVPNDLEIKVEGDSARPFNLTSPTYPAMWTEVPDSTDWSFTTDLRLGSVQQGDFYAGAIVDVIESGNPVRYTIGIEDGDFLRIRQATPGGVAQLTSINWDEGSAVVRIRRVGTQLRFEWREEPGVWNNLLTRSFAAASTCNEAGLFVSTDTTQAVRIEFDYALLVDPNFTSPTSANLRLTEIMYNPTSGSAAEFLEFKNTGSSPLFLEGVTLDETRPFGAFTFGTVTLNPGQYGVIVSDLPTFRSKYGNLPLVLGQWSGGNLSNGGERMIVRDPLSNIIHDFSYSDDDPWPVAADGDGPSLEVIDTEGNYNDPANWRASAYKSGSPGQEFAVDSDGDGLSGILESALGTNPNQADTDGDGFNDNHEARSGTDPLDPNSFFKIISVVAGANPDNYEVTWTSVPGLVYTVETLTPPSTVWIPLQAVTATGPTTMMPDNTNSGTRFYRVKVAVE